MVERLDNKTKTALSTYLADVRSLPNESAKTHRFAALIGELFPGTSASTHFAAGVEKVIRIDTKAGQRRRKIDSYYGNAVIEFENSLKATGQEAKRQLQELVSGIWAKEGSTPRPLIAIASDGIVWRTYRPYLSPGNKPKPKAEDVKLEELRELTLSENTLGDFWVWLTSLLFRPERTEPSARQFRLDFGVASPAFRDGMEVLGKAWAKVRASPEPRLAFETWQKYLTVTYGRLTEPPGEDEDEEEEGGRSVSASELEILFLKHTYLASIARLLIWASLSKGKSSKTLREVAKEVLRGEFFEAQNMANLVENDFFQWVQLPKAETLLAPVWERTIAQLLSYDLAHLGEDILKGVYQELVDPKDRHDLGEYYTPDWLCDRIVSELLPSKGFVAVLDPACGSGSFLRATIAHLIRANPNSSHYARLRAILDHVAGVDIHPLAVTISRATYVLALGPLIKAAKRPIQIPIYLADSLFLPTEVRQLRIGEVPGVEIKFAGRQVTVPDVLVRAPDLFDSAIAACTRVAIDHAESRKENPQSLRAYLDKQVPALGDLAGYSDILNALWKFTGELADLIRTRKNSIWAFIVRNSYRPSMLKNRFAFIVGNPPWLSYRYIADPEYQDEVKKRALEEYAIAPKSQRLFTQMELAAVFFAHSISWFGRDDAEIAFVMPRSVLSADQHENLRSRTYHAPFRLTAYWDLRGVQPLFKVPSCVLFARRDPAKGRIVDVLPVKEWEGKLDSRDVSWDVAKDRLQFVPKSGRVIFLGHRTALSTSPGRTQPNEPSPYTARFRDGATIFPRNFYFVKVTDLQGTPDPDRLYWAETDVEQAEDAKPPYNEVFMQGHVEGRFLYCAALARHLLPFSILVPPPIAIPVDRDGGVFRVLTADHLRKAGWREFARWMARAEKIWKSYRGEKASRMSIYERLDYHKGLTAQNHGNRHLVVYNVDGTNVSAAYVDRRSLPLPFIVDYRLYWLACASIDEADYLAAILNAESINDAIKPFQTVGLLGERHITKKVLDLPFPEFNPNRLKHRDLAALGTEARSRVSTLISGTPLPPSLARRRAMVREHLGTLAQEMDEIVKTLI